MRAPRCNLPKGTMIEIDPIGRVTVQFALQTEAQEFFDWLIWLGNASKLGEKLVVSEPREVLQ